MNFEEKMKDLEKIVGGMEAGDRSLDDMIKDFERGQKLAEECLKDLDSIKLKIEKVTGNNGGTEALKL